MRYIPTIRVESVSSECCPALTRHDAQQRVGPEMQSPEVIVRNMAIWWTGTYRDGSKSVCAVWVQEADDYESDGLHL